MKYFGFLTLLLVGQEAYGKCLQVDSVEWVAFKTPAKQGVKGKLPVFDLKGNNKGETLKDFSGQVRLVIDTSKVASGDISRDKKITRFFFGKMTESRIVASLKRVNEKKKQLILNVKMNGVSKDVPMNYNLNKSKVTAKGVIDILDFAAAPLASLNKACKALHQGKTWSDVELAVMAQISSSCN